MKKKKNKAEALKLISENMDLKHVAEETGYTLRSIYAFKKALDDKDSDTAKDVQLQSRRQYIEEMLENALSTLLIHLEQDATIDVIEGIVRITETLHRINCNENTTDLQRIGMRSEADGGQNPRTTSADAQNFADILEKTAEITETPD